MQVALAWGGGVGSLLALDELLREGHDVTLLHVSTEPDLAAATRALPEFVVEAQAAALGLPLRLARRDGRDEAAALEAALAGMKPERVAFGYVRNEGHGAWRLARMQRETGVEGVLPVRHLPPGEAARLFVERGHRGFVRAVLDDLPDRLLGRFLDEALVDDVDAEFGPRGWPHVRALAVGGPRFRRRVEAVAGDARRVEDGVRLDVSLAGC